MKFSRFIFLLVFPLYFISCKPQQKLVNYLEYVNDSTGKGEVKYPELVIQKSDRLSIQIYSLSTKPEVSDAIYNQPAAAGAGNTAAGYLVDNNGNIIHHRLGVIHAEGLTRHQLADEIKKRLTVPVELLKDPTVVVQLENFKVMVLGQVEKQGPIPVAGEKMNILEAIAMAGGIDDYGKKTKVKVVREQNGKRETGYIDLASKDIFQSPYYYLAQNDLIVVEGSNQKYKDQEQMRSMQKISFAFSFVTIIATLTSIFIRN
ncbi:MAG: polysaccharide biosynthesis/export family protein [Chitinophagaceae bacterium]